MASGPQDDALTEPGLSLHEAEERRIDEHDLNEQAWLVTRRPKEIATTAELKANVETTFLESGFEMFVAPQRRSEPAVSNSATLL